MSPASRPPSTLSGAVVPTSRHRCVVAQRRAVLRQERIKVDKLRDAQTLRLGYPGDHHSPIAVPDPHDLIQILILENRRDIPDVGVQIHVPREQMGTLTKARQRRRQDLVPVRGQ